MHLSKGHQLRRETSQLTEKNSSNSSLEPFLIYDYETDSLYPISECWIEVISDAESSEGVIYDFPKENESKQSLLEANKPVYPRNIFKRFIKKLKSLKTKIKYIFRELGRKLYRIYRKVKPRKVTLTKIAGSIRRELLSN